MLKVNKDLQNIYAVQLHNRFTMLQNDVTDTINNKYQHFITTNKETAKNLSPMKVRRQKMKYRDDGKLKLTRKDVPVAYLTYIENSASEKYQTLHENKMVLEEVYDTILTQYDTILEEVYDAILTQYDTILEQVCDIKLTQNDTILKEVYDTILTQYEKY